MNLSTLKTALGVVTGTSIKEVLFDFYSVMNEDSTKTYPFAFWDVGAAEIEENNAKVEATLQIPVYFAALFDYTSHDRMTKWQELKAQALVYFNKLNSVAGSKVYIDTRTMKLKLYEVANFSPDQDIAIMYTVTMKVYF